MKIYIETNDRIYRFEMCQKLYDKLIEELSDFEWLTIDGLTIRKDDIVQIATFDSVTYQIEMEQEWNKEREEGDSEDEYDEENNDPESPYEKKMREMGETLCKIIRKNWGPKKEEKEDDCKCEDEMEWLAGRLFKSLPKDEFDKLFEGLKDRK